MRWIALAVVVVLGAFGAYGAYLYLSTENAIQGGGPGIKTVNPEKEGAPSITLVVGSDSREGLTEQEKAELGAADEDQFGAVTGDRADTLILAHVDPNTDQVTMVQFPRDLYVPIDGGGKDRINAALLKGHTALVETVEDLTGLEINHYAQVNIAGFKDVVDAIGGIDLCLTEPVPFDEATGIVVGPEELPLVHFDGARAISYVRSRKNFATGDLERIQNQQKLLAAALDKVTSPSILLNPFRLRSISAATKRNVQLDASTSLNTLRNLGNQLRNFDPASYEAYTAPHKGLPELGEAQVIQPDMRAMKVMFDAIGNNQSPADADGVPSIDPASIEVAVYTAGAGLGVADVAAGELQAATTVGDSTVSIAETDDRPKHAAGNTVVRYRADTKEMAELVAAALPGAELRETAVNPAHDVVVVLGPGPLETRRIIQTRPIPIPEPDEQPAACRR